MWVTQVLAVVSLTFAASGHVTAENATDGTATDGGGQDHVAICSFIRNTFLEASINASYGSVLVVHHIVNSELKNKTEKFCFFVFDFRRKPNRVSHLN